MNQSADKLVLIITGLPPFYPKELEAGGVLLSPSLYKLNKANIPLHNTMPSLGAIVVATALSKAGIPTLVKDWYQDHIEFAQADIIGISGTNFGMHEIQEISRHAKRKNPACIVVVGGPVSWSFSPDFIFSTTPQVDYIVFGEGEETFVEFVHYARIGDKKRIKKIKGLLFRNDKRNESAKFREKIPEKAIPSPDWRLTEHSGRIPLLPVETARGCCYRCAFCSETNYWGKPVRFKEIPQIIREIGNDVRHHGISTFRIADSCFTAPEPRCEKVCSAIITDIINKNIPIKWSSFARVTNLQHPSMLRLMKKAGCVALDIGMESGDPIVLKNMDKNYTPQEIITAVTNARNAGLFTHCNVVVGFPGESGKTIKNTIDVLNTAQPDSYHCMLFDLAPNTVVSENLSSFGVKGNRLQWQSKTMTSAQAIQGINRIIKNVKHSCLMPMGELVVIFLTAKGYSPKSIKSFFNKIQANNAGKKEMTILDEIMRNHTVVTQQ